LFEKVENDFPPVEEKYPSMATVSVCISCSQTRISSFIYSNPVPVDGFEEIGIGDAFFGNEIHAAA